MPAAEQGVIVTEPRPGTSTDVWEAVAQAVRVGFGVVSLGLGVGIRTLEADRTTPRRPPELPVSDVADLLVGAAWGAARLSGRVATTGTRVAAPVVLLASWPPGVPRRLQPGHAVGRMVQRWQRDRPETMRSLGQWSATALPGAVEAALTQVDVERLVVTVIDSMDLDRVVADVVRRMDIDALVGDVVGRIDIDALVGGVVGRIDIDALVGDVVGRIDFDTLVAAVLGRIQIDAVATAALDQLDLTQLVLDRVDLGRVVAEVLERIDLTQVVLQQVDLIGVAEYVVEGIDLPEIIRESTGSVATEAVRGLRAQGVDADQAVARVVDRMLFRHRGRRAPEASPEHQVVDELEGSEP